MFCRKTGLESSHALEVTAILILSERGGAYTERRIHSQDQKSAGRSP